MLLGLLLASFPTTAFAQAELWLTHPDKSALFQRQNAALTFAAATNEHPTIAVDDRKTFQTIDGFGFTLTGGSAMHIIRMAPAARRGLLRELFATDGTNIGTSYLRLSIGASDLNERVFSYDDLPAGETDPELKKFDLGPDRADVIPVLKEILAINPAIKLLGSPWSAPTWMKTTNDTRGASLKPEFHAAYAKYFVRYIKAMEAEGIRIGAITVQNEPLHPGNNPSMFMPAQQQAAFIKRSLGPAFAAAKLDTRIILYDHNCDRPDYPLSILSDPEAAKYVDGSAFHLYAGKIEVLTTVHDAHPDKNLYFTEQWVGAPGNLQKELTVHVRELIIGATRNWSRTVLEWNLAANSRWEPHTDRGGCDRCLGAITIEGDKVTRNPAYYIIAHAAKFVRPGSVRIASNTLPTLPNVAFKAPDGRHVLVVLNDSRRRQTFNISHQGKLAMSALNSNAVGTFVW
ncbi:MAG TPA: glycoside hydrolase family 30 beta sandwich domain-containing protein [Verrucomicrobiae bacterium]|nr:glycoside hydrolase family 30 beta sandwich domain-containing protein [Verrucomicrobiae bacterium]